MKPSSVVWREHPLWNWLGLLPFFAFILFFLIVPSLNLFSGAFLNRSGAFTLENLVVFRNPNVIKAYLTSLQVSALTSLVGAVFGFFVAYAVTVGNAPRWMRNVIMTFSGLAASFGGVPLAFAFIATLGRTGFITALLKSICFRARMAAGLPVQLLITASACIVRATRFGVYLLSVPGADGLLTITPTLEGASQRSGARLHGPAWALPTGNTGVMSSCPC